MNKAGSYEMGRIISCPHCGLDDFCLFEKLDLEPQEPWQCKHCKKEAWYPYDIHGLRFFCPKCLTLNLVAVFVHSTSIECLTCGSEFDTQILNELRETV